MKSFLDKNLSHLAFVDKELAERMGRIPLKPSVQIISSQAGPPTASVVAPDGASILLHSERDPLREARSFALSQKIHEVDGCVLAGMGIGYPAIELSSRLDPQTWMGVVEAREDVFRAALEVTDLTSVLSRKNTMFFVGHDFLTFQHWLKKFLDQSEAEELNLVSHLPSLRLLPQFYSHVTQEIALAINRKKIELATLLRYGKELERNVISNLYDTAHAAGVAGFRDQFKGSPAIVIAAGPSLNAAVDLLKKVQGKAVLICVGKVLQFLLKSGVVPEFTAHLDMLPIGKDYFDGVRGLEEIALVYDPDSYYEAVAVYAGPKITFDTLVQMTQWSREAMGEKGYLEKGISVSHTAFFLARELGADPIILVGMDLAIPGERTHAEGVVKTWGGPVDEAKLDIARVPSVKGGHVRSLRSFLSFITAFESEFSRTTSRVINTSEEGALIRGAVSMPLSQAVEQFCTSELSPKNRIRECLTKTRTFERARFRQMAQTVVEGAKKIIEYCEQAQRHLKRLKMLDPTNKYDGAEFARLGTRVNEYRNMISRQEPVLPLLQRVMAPYAYEIRKITRKIMAVPAEDVRKRVSLEMQRTELFYRGYLDAAGFFLSHFQPVCARILGDRGGAEDERAGQ